MHTERGSKKIMCSNLRTPRTRHESYDSYLSPIPSSSTISPEHRDHTLVESRANEGMSRANWRMCDQLSQPKQ